MKLQLAAVALMALTTTQALAQYTSSMTYQQDTTVEGLRVSFVLPNLKGHFKVSGTVEGIPVNVSDSQSMSDTKGIAIGYANIPVQQIGYLLQGSLLSIPGDEDTVNVLRLEGNGAMGLSSSVFAKAGLNLAKPVSDTGEFDYTPEIGLQAGLGVQVTPNFGLDFTYTQMKMTTSKYGLTADLTISGLEIGLTGTF